MFSALPTHLLRDPTDLKLSPAHLYLHHQHAVQIIQLDESSPPPPRSPASHHSSSSSSSSSAPSSSASSAAPSSSLSSDPSSTCDDIRPSQCEQEAESEPVGSSYCSSDLPPEELESERDADETYSVRMKRVCAWRDDHSAASLLLSPQLKDTPIPLHSKCMIDNQRAEEDVDYDDGDDYHATDDYDPASYSSKRSRSHIATITSHSCPACDTTFPTRQSLRQHGRSGINEACTTAVEYAFE